MCMRTRPIKRTNTGAYIIGGVYHRVHPKILRAQRQFEELRARVGEDKALRLARGGFPRSGSE